MTAGLARATEFPISPCPMGCYIDSAKQAILSMDDRGGLLQRAISTLAIVVTAVAIAGFPGRPCAEPPADYAPGDAPFPEEGDFEPRQPNQVDRAQEAMSQSVNDVAKWFESFFGDERFVAEEAYSRIRLTPSVFFEEGEATDYKFRVNAKVKVPRMSKKLRLVIADTSEDEETVLARETFPEARQSDSDATAIGLQYFLKTKNKLNTSVSAGIKIGSGHVVDFFLGPRVRKTWDFDIWQIRFTERVRWYTDIGWESRTRFDFERLFRDDLFFRAITDLRWRKQDYNDEGFRLEAGPTLTQRLRKKAAIDYQWINVFNTKPSVRLDETTLRLRYRQRIWRKWLFFEVNPQVAFRNDDDFRNTPGIEFRLEASFGGLEDIRSKTRTSVQSD